MLYETSYVEYNAILVYSWCYITPPTVFCIDISTDIL